MAKFRAVMTKNFILKTRGAMLCCSVLEVLVPIAFIALMCLPRLLISDEHFGVTLHRPVPLSSLSWWGGGQAGVIFFYIEKQPSQPRDTVSGFHPPATPHSTCV
jgi:hypothetical protein